MNIEIPALGPAFDTRVLEAEAEAVGCGCVQGFKMRLSAKEDV